VFVAGGWPTQRGFRCVGIDAAEVSGWFRCPYGTPMFLGLRGPASELAGYFQWSLRDLLRRCARSFDAATAASAGEPALSDRAKRGVEWGPSDNSPAFLTPGRWPTKRNRVPEGRLNHPHTYCGSYSTPCFFKNAKNSSSKLRLR
jgi:hypothetical protein